MFKVLVPGSLMLFGEHAVLHGKMGVVATINAWLQIELIPNNSHNINIYSSFGNINLNINNLNNIKTNVINWEFVLTSIKIFNLHQTINQGFDLIITNKNLKLSSGFGSSAAVVVGVLVNLNRFFDIKNLKQNLFKQALHIVHEVQDGLGSGADIAASIYGGIISIKDGVIQKVLKKTFDLTAIYCGYKTKTADVIKIVNNKIAEHKKLYDYIFTSMNNCSKLALIAIQQDNLYMLGKIMNIAHGLMSGLGVVDNKLDQLACTLRAQDAIYGSKISGAGLGDCVIGLGTLTTKLFKEDMIESQFTLEIVKQGYIVLTDD